MKINFIDGHCYSLDGLHPSGYLWSTPSLLACAAHLLRLMWQLLKKTKQTKENSFLQGKVKSNLTRETKKQIKSYFKYYCYGFIGIPSWPLWGQMVQPGCFVLYRGISVNFHFLFRADRITCIVFSGPVLLKWCKLLIIKALLGGCRAVPEPVHLFHHNLNLYYLK